MCGHISSLIMMAYKVQTSAKLTLYKMYKITNLDDISCAEFTE